MVGLFPDVPNVGGLNFILIVANLIANDYLTVKSLLLCVASCWRRIGQIYKIYNKFRNAWRMWRFNFQLGKFMNGDDFGDNHVTYYPTKRDLCVNINSRNPQRIVTMYASLEMNRLFIFKQRYTNRWLNRLLGWWANYYKIDPAVFNFKVPHVSITYNEAMPYSRFHEWCIEAEIQLSTTSSSRNPRWGMLDLSWDDEVLLVTSSCELHGFIRRLQRCLPSDINGAYDRLHISLAMPPIYS
jgi:hypothetical protein